MGSSRGLSSWLSAHGHPGAYITALWNTGSFLCIMHRTAVQRTLDIMQRHDRGMRLCHGWLIWGAPELALPC